MSRRLLIVAFAAVAMLQTGCHGRVCAFFYRLTHCNDCCPTYGCGSGGYGYGAPAYGGPAFAPAAPCCSSPAPVYGAQPVAYGVAPVFTGAPQAMPGPSVYPTPTAPTPMPEKK